VCVMVRGDTPSATARPRYTDCDGATVISADGRVRQAFRRRIALRNGNSGNANGLEVS
jgi:type IV pilus assembly protein PilW